MLTNNMARGKYRRYMELVAYHIYHLEERTKEIRIPWREVTPELIKKYEEFNKRCVTDYIQKMKENSQTVQNGYHP